MDDRKEVSSLNSCRSWRFSLFSPHSLSSACFYFEIRFFLSKILEVSTTVQINIQIERIREQQEKNEEKTAREASKRGEIDSLTEDGMSVIT